MAPGRGRYLGKVQPRLWRYLNDTKRTPFTGEDIRFTKNGDTLYATVLKWPESGHVLVKSLVAGHAQIAKVDLLGNPSQLKWNLSNKGLEIRSDELRAISISGYFQNK